MVGFCICTAQQQKLTLNKVEDRIVLGFGVYTGWWFSHIKQNSQ